MINGEVEVLLQYTGSWIFQIMDVIISFPVVAHNYCFWLDMLQYFSLKSFSISVLYFNISGVICVLEEIRIYESYRASIYFYMV